MNARQKAKYYKKALEMLYQDYEYSAFRANEMIEAVHKKIEKHEERMVTCVEKIECSKPITVDTETAIGMIEMFKFNDDILRATVFEGHTDPDTGKYILEAKLTVVLPEFEEDNEHEY